jgi:hypothetical protein
MNVKIRPLDEKTVLVVTIIIALLIALFVGDMVVSELANNVGEGTRLLG